MLGCTCVPMLWSLDCCGTAVEVCWGVSATCEGCVCCVCCSGSANRLLVLLSVGVIGEPPLSKVGDVGPSDPCEESLVRFFLRNPSDGITEVSVLPFRFRGTQGSWASWLLLEANFLALSSQCSRGCNNVTNLLLSEE